VRRKGKEADAALRMMATGRKRKRGRGKQGKESGYQN